jgi:hypothetical protein
MSYVLVGMGLFSSQYNTDFVCHSIGNVHVDVPVITHSYLTRGIRAHLAVFRSYELCSSGNSPTTRPAAMFIVLLPFLLLSLCI